MERDPRDVVAAKRDGRRLPSEEVRAFVLSYSRGEVPDYLAAAFLMAVFINGLDDEETLALTRAMVDSGETLPLGSISRLKVDKHSTGGVADGVTLVFAPVAASLVAVVKEAVSNSLRHAHASTIHVRVSCDGDRVIVHVSDDGTGFDVDADYPGLGLGNMARRAAAAGGSCTIDSVPKKGTIVRAEFPLA